MNKISGKKFIFAVVAVICVSITAIILKYDGDIYSKLIGAVCGIFLIAQGYVDAKKGVKDE